MTGHRGSTTVEMVLLAPLLGLVLSFVTSMGRLVDATMTVRGASERAARATSMVAEQRMSVVGSTTALSELRSSRSCVRPRVSVSHTVSRSPRTVTVKVTCSVNFAGVVAVLPLPRSISFSSSEVIDVFTFR
jgi:Flp pilus assembly protein TadG